MNRNRRIERKIDKENRQIDTNEHKDKHKDRQQKSVETELIWTGQILVKVINYRASVSHKLLKCGWVTSISTCGGGSRWQLIIDRNTIEKIVQIYCQVVIVSENNSQQGNSWSRQEDDGGHQIVIEPHLQKQAPQIGVPLPL